MTADERSAWIDDVLTFWFSELDRKAWFGKAEATDAAICDRFAALYERLAEATPPARALGPDGTLAAILVLDQFPRNMFRNSARAFATDRAALALARDAVALGYDRGRTGDEKLFLYLPFEHSEAIADQELAVALISAIGDEEYTRYAIAHREVIATYGRFPHRNAVLGRTSTPAELEYLSKPGAGF